MIRHIRSDPASPEPDEPRLAVLGTPLVTKGDDFGADNRFGFLSRLLDLYDKQMALTLPSFSNVLISIGNQY